MLARLLILGIHGDLRLSIPSNNSEGPDKDSSLIANNRIFSVVINDLTIREFDNLGAEDIWLPPIAVL